MCATLMLMAIICVGSIFPLHISYKNIDKTYLIARNIKRKHQTPPEKSQNLVQACFLKGESEQERDELEDRRERNSEVERSGASEEAEVGELNEDEDDEVCVVCDV